MPDWKTVEATKNTLKSAETIVVGEDEPAHGEASLKAEAAPVIEHSGRDEHELAKEAPRADDDTVEPVDSVETVEPAATEGVAPIQSPTGESAPDLGSRYRVIEFIGSGGMGTVWKVHDNTLNEDFAVKVLKPALVADATAQKRFEKEAGLAAELTHANIAAIFGPGVDTSGRPYIVMRYVEGESLAEVLAREGKLSEERATDIFKQMLEALSYSHSKGIVHRDIKPSNIIISKAPGGGDLVSIVDFGIAKSIYEEVSQTQALTKAVDVFGSPSYMSPEQFLGQEATAQSDLYSAGCVFYEMLTGFPPFRDENPVKLILQHLDEQPDLSYISGRCFSVVSACLMKELSVRPQSADFVLKLIGLPGSSGSCEQATDFLIPFASGFLFCSAGLGFAGFSGTFVGTSFLVLWLLVTAVNRSSAIRNPLQLRLEFSLLILAVCLSLLQLISMLAATWNFVFTVLAVFTMVTVSSRQLAVKYDTIVKALLVRFFTHPHNYTIEVENTRSATFALACFNCIAFLVVATFSATVVFGFNSGANDTMQGGMFTLLIMFYMGTAFLQSMKTSKEKKKRFDPKKVWKKSAIVSQTLLFVLASLTGAGFAISPLEPAVYLRQQSANPRTSRDSLLSIANEAIAAPDTTNGVNMKIRCSENLWRFGEFLPEALTLNTQIINSKTDISVQQRSEAYARLIGTMDGRKKYQDYRALLNSYLEVLQQYANLDPKTGYLKSSMNGLTGPRGQAANVASIAYKNGDFLLAERATKIAEDTSRRIFEAQKTGYDSGLAEDISTQIKLLRDNLELRKKLQRAAGVGNRVDD